MVLSPLLKRSALFLAGLGLGITATVTAAGVLGSDVFTDVQRGAFYDEAVGEMYDLGVIKGYDDGRFGPNDYVTRGQVAVMMKRMRDEMGGAAPDNGESSSEDESSSSSEKSSSSSSKVSSSSQASIGAEGAIRFAAKSFTVNETAGVATVSIVRTNGNTGTVSAQYRILSGSATAGTDYTLSNGTVNFATRETSKTFTVAIGDDTLSEGLETIVLEIFAPTGGAVLGSPTQATINIVDNETTSGSAGSSSSVGHEVSFNANAYAVSENSTTAVITVKRTGGTGPVTVNYTFTNGTAVLGSEYNTSNGSVTFDGSETTKNFTVTIMDDKELDGSKSLTMALASPTGGATLGTPATAQLTIIDDETTPAGSGSLKFSTASYSAAEGEKAIITVARVGGSQGTVTVSYSTFNGTATSGTDYVSTTGTLTFLPGESSKSFFVQTNADTQAGEGEETVNLTLSSPTGGAILISPSSAILRIGG